MLPFQDIATANVEKDADYVVGASKTLAAGIYPATLINLFVRNSPGGATGIVTQWKLDDGQEYSETVYITTRAGKPTYVDKRTGKDKFLPGYQMVDDICLLLGDTPLNQTFFENKIVKIYDYTAQKDVPTEVPVATKLLGKKANLCIVNVKKNKQVKDADGNYVSTAEEYSTNELEKVLSSERKTANEVRANGDAAFANTWDSVHTGTVRDKRTIKDQTTGSNPTAGTAGTAASSTGNAAPAKSLFG